MNSNRQFTVEIYPSIVLVIDDDKFIQKQVQLCLEKEGHEVIIANNGLQGLIAYENHQPDLVLLDALMPEMDGFECCKKLLEYPNAEYTPILMITGLEEPRFVDLAFEVGASDYITKPIHWAVLRQRVKRLIYQSRLQKQLTAANQLLAKLAITDPLTQVSNRRHFDEYLAKEWSRSTRHGNPIALILCDIDYFKLYNDTYGHPAGDLCLVKVAQALKNQAKRASDLVARYGGEEFAIILTDTDLWGAKIVAENIRNAVKNLSIPHGQSSASPWVTLSVGVSCLMACNNCNIDVLIEKADQALYLAKKKGRDQVCAFSCQD